jgi:hypothetical protein
MGGWGDRSAAEHVVVEDVEEVVELQGHLQSLSHVTLTSSETSKRQSTYRPRTHKKTAGSISACEVYLVTMERVGGIGNGDGGAVEQ